MTYMITDIIFYFYIMGNKPNYDIVRQQHKTEK